MTVTFQITTDADFSCGLSAPMRRDQLDMFLALLHAEGRRTGRSCFDAYLDGEQDIESMLRDGFEVRVCPLAPASISPIFGHDPQAMTVFENAQSRGRKVTIWMDPQAASIMMCPSMTSDADAEFDLPIDEGLALLACLEMTDWNDRLRPADEIARKLAEPATRARMAAENLAVHIPLVERLLDTAKYDPTSQFGWF